MPRAQKNYHYIYKTTCLVNQKFYIGMHSTNDITDGYIGSGKRLWNSINKHGRENHVFEILEYVPDRIELVKREKEIVNLDLLKDPLCMNLMIGGEGGLAHLTIESFKACQLAAVNSTKKKWKEDSIFRSKAILRVSKIMKTNHILGKIKYDTFTGKTHTEETKLKMRKPKNSKESNPQFGKCWIYHLDLKQSKSIKKEQLDQYLTEGWIKGRKMF